MRKPQGERRRFDLVRVLITVPAELADEANEYFGAQVDRGGGRRTFTAPLDPTAEKPAAFVACGYLPRHRAKKLAALLKAKPEISIELDEDPAKLGIEARKGVSKSSSAAAMRRPAG